MNSSRTVFLSYAREDRFFAELAEIKLREAGFQAWRDQTHLRPGAEWRREIEDGIQRSFALMVVLSQISVDSAYVTFEWAYALGQAKVVISVRLNVCSPHPRLEVIQYVDFTNPGELPWSTLIERLKNIESASELPTATRPPMAQTLDNAPAVGELHGDDYLIAKILTYLDERGFQRVSFERLREVFENTNLTDKEWVEFVRRHSDVFRRARVRPVSSPDRALAGLAKQRP